MAAASTTAFAAAAAVASKRQSTGMLAAVLRHCGDILRLLRRDTDLAEAMTQRLLEHALRGLPVDELPCPLGVLEGKPSLIYAASACSMAASMSWRRRSNSAAVSASSHQLPAAVWPRANSR